MKGTVCERAFRVQNEIGRTIRCDLRLPPGEGPFPVVVILHGFKGFKDWGMFPPTARRLAQRGFATVVLNTSMNGVEEKLEEFTDLESFARNTPRREVLDVERVIEEILERRLDSSLDRSRLGVLGHSRGGGVMLLVASRDPRIRCVVTWASIATFFRYGEHALAQWRSEGKLEVPNLRTGQRMWLERAVLDDLEARRDEYDLERACRRLRAPLLAIHGELDEAVDPGDSRTIVEWAASAHKRFLAISGAGHTFGAAHPWAGPSEAWEKALGASARWFARWLGGA